MKRVLLVNAYVRENAGDAALLAVAIDQVRRALPGAAMVISGIEPPGSRPEFQGVTNIGSIRRFVAEGSAPRSVRILRRAVFLAFFGLYLAAPRVLRRGLRRLLPGEVGGELRAIASADAVVSIGGGYIQAARGLDGLQGMVFCLVPLAAARREGVPVVLLPQSFGPFRTGLQRALVKSALGEARLVCAREEISLRALHDAGLDPSITHQIPDSAFALRQPPRPSAVGSHRALRVGITTRSFLPGSSQRAYERAVADVVDDLMSDGHHVVLVPQVTTDYLGDDDRISNARVADDCTQRPEVVEDAADYRERTALYAGLDLMIGTRFHSVIFALTAGTPCVAIAYEHKTRGIMRSLGLEEWVVDMADVARDPERLRTLVRRALEDRTAYAERLTAVVGRHIVEADRVVPLLSEALSR